MVQESTKLEKENDSENRKVYNGLDFSYEILIFRSHAYLRFFSYIRLWKAFFQNIACVKHFKSNLLRNIAVNNLLTKLKSVYFRCSGLNQLWRREGANESIEA